VTARRAPALLGRATERELLDGLLGSVRGGRSAALVIRGEAGAGKTTLLRYCSHQASGFRVAQLAGVEAEMELPFAAVHQLCAPLLPRVDALPAPQSAALRIALGASAGDAPDPFMVAVAVLSLVAAVAEDQPLLCLVDDAQWLDRVSAQVLGFVARRLLAESVAIVFAVREPPRVSALDGLPEIRLGGLGEQDARTLLDWAVAGRLDKHVRDRIVAETGGNPLALLELPHGMSAAELAGGFDMASGGLQGQLETEFAQRLGILPEDTQRLLLLAATDPVGETSPVLAAARQLGMGTDVLRPAVEAQLVEVGERISFRHPLIRSAAIHSATSAARRETHQALADVTDPERDPDRRAWHRAMAAAGPDEEVADELERSARRAQMRGGLAAAAAFLERAAELTAASGPRAARALAAADAHDRAGAQATALRLIAQAQTGPLDALQRARVHIVRGRIAFGSRHGRDAPPLLLAAARELEPLDPLAAREAYLDALAAALFVGRLAGEVGWAEVAHAARAAPASAGRPQDLLLDGLVVALTEGLAAGAPVLKVAVAAFQTADLPPAQAVRWLWLAAHAAHDLWDVASWAELSTRRVALARETGSLATLPLALNNRIALHLFAGELSTAASLVDEIAAITEATGSGRPPYSALTLAAFRGRDAEATGLLHVVEPEVVARGDGMALTLVHHAKAVLANGLGHYREACEAARRGAADTRELGFSSWSLPQLVEAAVRSDQPDLAEDALRRLRRTTRPSGTDWALGIEARCRALVSAEAEAEACYRDAIDSLTRTPLRAELARCHLLYGEWLRRAGRRVDARTQLRLAHEMFTDMGMEGFAERSRHERLATGETVRRRTVETSLDLTPQEAQIAQLARAGRTNADIGAQLFLSPRTVEWHLKKVFGKLGITSRRGLHDALPGRSA